MTRPRRSNFYNCLTLILSLYITQTTAYYSLKLSNAEGESASGRPAPQQTVSPTECHHLTLKKPEDPNIKPNLNGFAAWNMADGRDQSIHAIRFHFKQRCNDPVGYVIAVFDGNNLGGIHYADFKNAAIDMPVGSYQDLDYQKEIEQEGLLYGLNLANIQGSILEWDDTSQKWIVYPNAIKHRFDNEHYDSESPSKDITRKLRTEAVSMAQEADAQMTPEDKIRRDIVMAARYFPRAALAKKAKKERPRGRPAYTKSWMVKMRDLDSLERAPGIEIPSLILPGSEPTNLNEEEKQGVMLDGANYFPGFLEPPVPTKEEVQEKLDSLESAIKQQGNKRRPKKNQPIVDAKEILDMTTAFQDPVDEQQTLRDLGRPPYPWDSKSAVYPENLSGGSAFKAGKKSPTDDFFAFGEEEEKYEPYGKLFKPSPEKSFRATDP